MYENAVMMDLDGAVKLQQVRADRFRVSDNEEDVPVILVRRPEDKCFSTPPVKKHFYEDPSGQGMQVIPSPSVVNRESILDLIKQQLLTTGAYHTESQALKDFIDGSISHDLQVIDLRNHIAVIHGYQNAVNTKDPLVIANALAALHQAILTEPVKLWSVSRTVYSAIVGGITSYKREKGNFIDPTQPMSIHLLWVGKQKATKGPARYVVRFGWGNSFALPEALFADGRVKLYNEMLNEYTEQLQYWPDERIAQLLGTLGVYINGANLLPAGQGVPAALPPAPVAATVLPAAVAAQPVPVAAVATPVPVPIVTPSVPAVSVVAPGATVSAAALPCFGKTPNFSSPKCQQCPQNRQCMEALTANLNKPQAAATAVAVVPPVQVAQPATAVQATTAIAEMVAAAIKSTEE